jgi:superfamily II DNA helicase RecQ
MKMVSIESLISCYQDLLLAEYAKLEKYDFTFEDPNSRFTLPELSRLLSPHGVSVHQLMAQNLLVQYPDSTYRTMHMDLIYRAVNLKTAFWSRKIPLEFRLCKPREEFIPSFSEMKLEELLQTIQLPKNLAEALIKALRSSGYNGLAFHQNYYLKKILTTDNRCYLLVSPTASGKSLIFYLILLVHILKTLEVKGTKAIILYPRKALASDQLLKFLKILVFLNAMLTDQNLRPITVGIDDGDTPRSPSSEEVKKRQPFRGMRCVAKNCDGMLRYEPKKDKTSIVCDKCGKVYGEIIGTKGEIWSSCPDIIFSNLSTLNRRLMMVAAQDTLGAHLKWIVMDEAHVYREELGGHSRWLLKRIMARFQVILKGDVRFIVSSATIYNPRGFVSKLLGLTNGIYYEPYEEVLKFAKEKFRKLTLDLILAPNPLRSAESLVEELCLLLAVWGYSNAKKVMLFVDNVSEIERLYDFVVKTIITERQEQNDHINPKIVPIVNDITNPFSWRSIAQSVNNIDSASLTEIFNFHYGELQPEMRARIEEEFKRKNAGFLFSTSTLELGMDIGNIAAIVQYKIPITSESYVQRVGRAGRSNDVLRVALGILVVTNSPSQVRYVIGDEYLRLIKPQVEIPVAWENEEIRRQHLIFSLLDVLASQKYPTFLDYTTEVKPSWVTVSDVLQSLQNIIAEAKKNASLISSYLNLISNEPEIQKTFNDILDSIMSRIQEAQTQVSRLSCQDIEDCLKSLRNAEDQVIVGLRQFERIRNDVEDLLSKLSIQELAEYKQKIADVQESLRNVLSALEKIWGR